MTRKTSGIVRPAASRPPPNSADTIISTALRMLPAAMTRAVYKGFRWRPDGPVMAYFRREVVPDYHDGGFDGDQEMLVLIYGSIGSDMAQSFNERLHRPAQDYARQHRLD
ncbi:MAG: hypothetical protein QM674_21500 [Burkholderiaceae bacterium]